jgi:ABC-2 type transport system permease protein
MNFMLYHLSLSLGVFLFELVLASLIFIALILFFPLIHYILTPLRIIVFILALIAANIIYTQLYLFVGILAFWIKEGSFLIEFVRKLVKFLAGGYIPIALFPLILQKILEYLPFAATIYFPTIILTDKNLTNADLLGTIVLQSFWLIILFAMNALLWNIGIRKYESVGI